MCQRPQRTVWLIAICAAMMPQNINATEPGLLQNDNNSKSINKFLLSDLQVAGDRISSCDISGIRSELMAAYRNFQSKVHDYTAVLIKRERLAGKLSSRQFAKIKIRTPRHCETGKSIPHGVYVKFYHPRSLSGREILYVENQRGGRMLARKGGTFFANFTREFELDHAIAKSESNYAISDTGVDVMFQQALKLLTDHEKDADCTLTEFERKQIEGRSCRHFELRLAEKNERVPYQYLRFLFDDELNVPLYVAQYGWDTSESNPGVDSADQMERTLREEFFLARLKLNVGLSEEDFRSDHPDYKFSVQKTGVGYASSVSRK